MIRSTMEYANSAWIDATLTIHVLAQLYSIQNRAKRVIGLPSNKYEDHRIQPLSHRRAVGAVTLFYRMFYKEAPELLCQLMPDIHVHDPRLQRSVRTHDLAVEVPRSNLVSHARSFLPSTAQLWNSLPAQIPAIRIRASFNREVNHFVGATLSATSKMIFLSLLLMPSYAMSGKKKPNKQTPVTKNIFKMVLVSYCIFACKTNICHLQSLTKPILCIEHSLLNILNSVTSSHSTPRHQLEWWSSTPSTTGIVKSRPVTD